MQGAKAVKPARHRRRDSTISLRGNYERFPRPALTAAQEIHEQESTAMFTQRKHVPRTPATGKSTAAVAPIISAIDALERQGVFAPEGHPTRVRAIRAFEYAIARGATEQQAAWWAAHRATERV